MEFTFQRFFGYNKVERTYSFEEIYRLAMNTQKFIEADILATYTHILTDVIERCHGVPEKIESTFWDSCIQDDANEGLITLIATAMTKRLNLFLVYSPTANVVRRATLEEELKIIDDYKTSGSSSIGIFVSFKNYLRSEMLQVYSQLEYCTISSINKKLNLSKAIQVKIFDLRKSISAHDSDACLDQAEEVAKALSDGREILLDAQDEIMTINPEIDSNKEALHLINQKRAFILGLPESYVTGKQTTGIGATGEGDSRAVEKGLRGYFFSIMKPILLGLYGISAKFKESDFRDIQSKLEVVRTFDLISDDLISKSSKVELVSRVFGLDSKEELRKIEKEQNEVPDDNRIRTFERREEDGDEEDA